MLNIFVFVVGLALGSFINALVWRTHEKTKKKSSQEKASLSIMRGRSMCPQCKHQLSAIDLVPVVSWVLLKGRCKYCSKPISWQYPLIEIMTGLLCLVAYLARPFGTDGVLEIASLLLFVPIIVTAVAMSLYDIKWMLLPNELVYSFALATILWVMSRVLVVESSLAFIAGSIIGSVVFGGFFYIIYQVSNGKWIGGGDVRLGFILGLLLGWQRSIIGLTLAAYLATALILVLVILQKYHKKMRIPFGPFLLAGSYVAILWGGSVIDWYLRISGISG